MKVLSADARKLYRSAGAQVDEATQIVRLDRGLVGASLATAPRDITLHTVDPQRNVPLVGQLRRICVDLGAAEHHGHGRRPARRNVRGFLQHDEAVPELRGDPCARRRDRAAGHSGPRPSSGGDARAADAVRQGSLHILPRPQPGRRQFRADPPRARHLARRVSFAPVHLHHHQHQFAAAARHTDGRRHHRLRHRGASADHHAVHAGRRDGAGDHRGRIDAGARRGARRVDAGADREARRAGGVWQLHLERRHEIRVAGLRHARSTSRRLSARASWRAFSDCRGAPRTPPPRTSPTRSPRTNRR